MVTHLDAVITTGMLAHVSMVNLTSILSKGCLQRAIWSSYTLIIPVIIFGINILTSRVALESREEVMQIGYTTGWHASLQPHIGTIFRI